MKSRVLWVLLVFFGFWSSPAVANNRFIVRTPSGLASLQQVCLVLGCNVVPGGLDGSLSKLFLVTTPDCLVATLGCIDPNVFLQLLRSQPGIQHVELDALLKVMQGTATAPPPSALSDNTPVNYFGANVIHGYVNQPAITDRKSTRLNSSHQIISYAVFCLKKKKKQRPEDSNGNVTRTTIDLL